MIATVVIAPVRKSIRVKANQAHAFDVFTAGLERWWPRTHTIGNPPMKMAVMEPRLGGRWYEKGEDGSECEWGRVVAWEPPARLVLSWTINGKFQADESVESEVEVRFIPESPNRTRVELEHRIAAADAEALREAVDSPRGWGSLLEIYARRVAA